MLIEIVKENHMKCALIVDDQKEMRDLYVDFFNRDFGLTDLTFAQDGIEAYFQCSTQKFDLITLDHEMPRLKGLDFLVALKNTPGLNQHTPVIIISAFLPNILNDNEQLFAAKYSLYLPTEQELIAEIAREKKLISEN